MWLFLQKAKDEEEDHLRSWELALVQKEKHPAAL
jgi:hypothetical protein